MVNLPDAIYLMQFINKVLLIIFGKLMGERLLEVILRSITKARKTAQRTETYAFACGTPWYQVLLQTPHPTGNSP